MTRSFLIIPLFIILCASPLCAQETLSPPQIERVKEIKRILRDVDERSMKETFDQLYGSPYPEGSLQILEAVALVYSDIVRDYDVRRPDAKRRLYSKIQLAMAYFQLGGVNVENPESGSLNILIQRKLKHYLSPDLLSDPELFHTLQ